MLALERELLQIKFNDFNSFVSFVNARKPGMFNVGLSKEDLTSFIVNCFEEQTIKELLNINENDISDFISVSNNDRHVPSHYNKEPFSVSITSTFLRSLIINCQDCNWVDIENEYYDSLIACKKKDGEFNKEKIVLYSTNVKH